MRAVDATVLDDPQNAHYAVVSTRLPRARLDEYLLTARESGLPVLVLVHSGGEADAVQALRAGGQVAIAEGDVDALRSLQGGGRETDAVRTESILSAYETRVGRLQKSLQHTVAMVDPISGLPAEGALRLRLSEPNLGNSEQMRVISMSAPALIEMKRSRLGSDGQTLLHRRIANGTRVLCQGKGELFDTGDGFTLLLETAELAPVHELGERIAEMIATYAPDGQSPLTIAIGHAGPESSPDAATLRELAIGAEFAARQEETSTMFGADELARPVATATGLDVTLRLAQLAAEREGATPRDEVAEVAANLALRLDLEYREQLLVRFCAAVSDIGAALVDDEGNRVAAAAALLDPIAGPTVGLVLRALGEHWDGTGVPDALVGSAIPVAARIIAVAEQLISADYATERIVAGSGTLFDPAVVHAAVGLAGER
jgi:HD-GYP domain-containing protein (c-di-GMP phosphodiesterase class II)